MRTSRAILVGLLALGVSLSAGSAAGASVTYDPITSFGAGTIEKPVGISVDQASGAVYVGNFLSRALIDKFKSLGTELSPPSPFGEGQSFFGFEFFSGVAVDPVDGSLYALDGYGHQIQRYDGSSGALLSQFAVTGTANYLGLATDVQIASDAAGNVYVPNASDAVEELDASGSLIRTITGTGATALEGPTGVAVDSTGDVYIADTGHGRIEEFDASGAFLRAIGMGVDQTTGADVCTAASGDVCGSATDGAQAVAVDAAGNVYVGDNDGSGFHVVVYDSSGAELADFGEGAIGSSETGSIDTLAVGPSGLVYVTDGANDVVWVYARPEKPSLANVISSVVKQTSARVDATIDPRYFDTTYRFEYGTSAAYGTSIPAIEADIGQGLSGPDVVGQELTGLQPGTVYHYRVVARNAAGETVGADQTFTTPPLQPPVVASGQAGDVTQSTATLSGTIETQGFETTYEFDLGTDTSYGTRIFGDAGSQSGTQTFTVALQGLTPATTYHYRLVASNIFGTTYGVDQTLTTPSYPSAALAAPQASPLVPTPPIVVAAAGTSKSKPAAKAKLSKVRRRGKGLGGHGRKVRASSVVVQHTHVSKRRSK